MKESEFIAERKKLTKSLDLYKKKIDEKYTTAVGQYLDSNCPVEVSKVYELEPGKRPLRTGFKRFIIYTRDVQFFGRIPIISVGGWWLNNLNIPTKWDNITVANISNPTIFILSENQTAFPCPNANKSEQ